MRSMAKMTVNMTVSPQAILTKASIHAACRTQFEGLYIRQTDRRPLSCQYSGIKETEFQHQTHILSAYKAHSISMAHGLNVGKSVGMEKIRKS